MEADEISTLLRLLNKANHSLEGQAHGTLENKLQMQRCRASFTEARRCVRRMQHELKDAKDWPYPAET
jgi:hypothetical protein